MMLTLDSSDSSLLEFRENNTLPMCAWRFCCSNCANCGFWDNIAGFCWSNWARAGFCTSIWLSGDWESDWIWWGILGDVEFVVWLDWDKLPGGLCCLDGLWGVWGGVGGLPGAIDDPSFSSFTLIFPATKDCHFFFYIIYKLSIYKFY